MAHTDYDQYRDRYREDLDRAVSFAGTSHDFFTRAKAEELVRLARLHLGDPARLDALDVGCGIGLTDRHLAGRFRSLTGTDVSPGVLETAARENPGVRYELAERGRLPFDDDAFRPRLRGLRRAGRPARGAPSVRRRAGTSHAPGRACRRLRAQPLQPVDAARRPPLRVRRGRPHARHGGGRAPPRRERRDAGRSRLSPALPVAAEARPRRRARPPPAPPRGAVLPRRDARA